MPTEDEDIVHSAERMSAKQEATKQAIAASRHKAWMSLGMFAVLGGMFIKCVGSVTDCQVASSASSVRIEELYLSQLNECEKRVGVGKCWQLQYQHCLASGEMRMACDGLVPAQPVDAEFLREKLYLEHLDTCRRSGDRQCYWRLQYQNCIDMKRPQDACNMLIPPDLRPR